MTSEQARTEAERLLATLDTDSVGAFATDTRAELERRGFVIRDAAPSPEGDGCSVAGSFQPGPPPVITVAADRSPGRRRFTALHEFGHSLIEQDDQVHDLLFEQPDHGTRLAEEICDAVAAELLLPKAVVDGCIDGRGPAARSVRDLFHSSRASREAVCVRAAQLLHGEGHIMLARDGVAVFTASHDTPYRVRRGVSQGVDHITTAAQQHGTARRIERVTYQSGGTSDRYHADAIADADGFVFAVFVADRPPWEHGFALPIADRTDPDEVECPHCEVQFTTMAAPCQKCGDHVHAGGCGRCSCESTTKRLCSHCFTKKAVHLFASAESDICIDCDGG